MSDRGFKLLNRPSIRRLMGLFAAAGLQIFVWSHGAAADPTKVLGEWLTEDKVSRIALIECDDAICGHISWIREADATNDAGEPVTDVNNPDAV